MSATVVVADDSPVVLRTLAMTIERAGCTVEVAEDGEGALELVRRLSPPILFVDAQMPGIDGYDVVREIRTDPPSGGAPYVIMLTGSAEDEDRRRAEAVGVDEFMTKPFSPSVVVARVRELLAQ